MSRSHCVGCNLFFSLYLELSLSRTNSLVPCEFKCQLCFYMRPCLLLHITLIHGCILIPLSFILLKFQKSPIPSATVGVVRTKPKNFFRAVIFVPWWCPNSMQNKTSIQWTPGSQVYLNIKKKFFDQKWFLNKKKHKSCMINN